MTVHTPMSYHLARLRTIQTAYQTIYLMNTSVHPPYEDILAIDEELSKIPTRVSPPFFSLCGCCTMGGGKIRTRLTTLP